MGMLDWMWVGYYRVREYLSPGYVESQAKQNPHDIFLVFSNPILLNAINPGSVAKLAKAYYQQHKNFPKAISADPKIALEFYLLSSRWNGLFQLAQEHVEAAKQLWDSGLLIDDEKFTLLALHHQKPCFAVEAADYCANHCADQKLLEAFNSEALNLTVIAKNHAAAFDRIFQQPKLVQRLKDPDALLSTYLKPSRRLLTKANPEKITQMAQQNIAFAKRILSHPRWLEKLSKPQIIAIILKHRSDETFARELPELISHHKGDFADIVVDPDSQAKQNLERAQQIFTTPALYQSLGEERLAGIIKKLKSVSKYSLIQLSEMLAEFKTVIKNQLWLEHFRELQESTTHSAEKEAAKKEEIEEAYNVFFNENYVESKYYKSQANVVRIPVAELKEMANYNRFRKKYQKISRDCHPDKVSALDSISASEKSKRIDLYKKIKPFYELIEKEVRNETVKAFSPKKSPIPSSPLKLFSPTRKSTRRRLSFSDCPSLGQLNDDPIFQPTTNNTPIAAH